MVDISGTGLQIQIKASNTFPTGFTVTEFADDADPFDSASMQIADKAMTLNGTQVSWSVANPIPMTVNVLPRGEDDLNLGILLEANRIGSGKSSAKDVITAVVTHADGETTTLTGGVITDGILLTPVASAGRKKTKAYIFSFENKTGS